MRFISKSSNLLVVLEPGLSAQPLTGTPPKPTVSVRFKDGIAEVPDGQLADRMLGHPALNADFVLAEDVGNKDPYASSRVESEPVHDLTELKHGTPVSRISRPLPLKITPQLQAIINQEAVKIAKELLPSMLEETLKNVVKAHESMKSTSKKTTKQRGRPKNKVVVEKEEISEETPSSEEELQTI